MSKPADNSWKGTTHPHVVYAHPGTVELEACPDIVFPNPRSANNLFRRNGHIGHGLRIMPT
jgi:hypothetical protein